MNARLQQFLSAENISQSLLADTLGVARASISHIISGRNKPGFDFIESMARHYPSLNIEWLITGKGRMYKEARMVSSSAVSETSDDLFADEFAPKEPANVEISPEKAPEEPSIPSPAAIDARPQITNNHGIHKMIIFFEDGTYQELK